MPIRPRAIASICCSPPDSKPGAAVQALLQAREAGEQRLDLGLDIDVLAGVRAEQEIVAHAELGEHLAALGHQDQAGADDPCAGLCCSMARRRG